MKRIVAAVKRTAKRIKEAAMRPMTQHEFDHTMAMAGAERCPYCRKWLPRHPNISFRR